MDRGSRVSNSIRSTSPEEPSYCAEAIVEPPTCFVIPAVPPNYLGSTRESGLLRCDVKFRFERSMPLGLRPARLGDQRDKMEPSVTLCGVPRDPLHPRHASKGFLA